MIVLVIRKSVLWLVVWAGIVMPIGELAAQDVPPFVLSSKAAVDLPEGRGMDFFYGDWEVSGGQGGGPVSITPDAIIWLGTRDATEYKYRVLYVADNYVLIAFTHRVHSGRTFTQFGVLFLEEGLYSKKSADNASMVKRYCMDGRPSGRDEVMESATPYLTWSDEKFLEEFAARCAKTIPNPYSQVSFGEGWSGTGFYRP